MSNKSTSTRIITGQTSHRVRTNQYNRRTRQARVTHRSFIRNSSTGIQSNNHNLTINSRPNRLRRPILNEKKHRARHQVLFRHGRTIRVQFSTLTANNVTRLLLRVTNSINRQLVNRRPARAITIHNTNNKLLTITNRI